MPHTLVRSERTVVGSVGAFATHALPLYVYPLLQETFNDPLPHALHDVEHVGDVSVFPAPFVQAALRV